MRTIDETGHRYGHLTVIRRDNGRHSGTGVVWLCRCDCGNTRLVPGGKLRNGSVTQCLVCSGRTPHDIRPGVTIGNKTIIRKTQKGKRSGEDRYEVRCKCGEVYEVTRASLWNVNQYCRKCYAKTLIKDEEGKRYGMLTVIRKVPAPTYYGDIHKQYYECRCDCGNTIITTGMYLRSGRAFSCGCTIRTTKWRREHGSTGDAAEVLPGAAMADGGKGGTQGGSGECD